MEPNSRHFEKQGLGNKVKRRAKKIKSDEITILLTELVISL